LIPRRILQATQAVCCDLWEAYIEAFRVEIPTVRILADRFHVARYYRDAADEIRKTELQRLKKELPKEEYQKLNGSFRAFWKKAKDLNKEERKILRGFFEYSPCTKQACDFRDELTAIYDMNLSKNKPNQKSCVGFFEWKKRLTLFRYLHPPAFISRLVAVHSSLTWAKILPEEDLFPQTLRKPWLNRISLKFRHKNGQG
jgi:transposase